MPKKTRKSQIRARKAPEQKRAQDPQLTKPPEKQCPVVGIGASAGGLEAFTGLLRHLRGDTGMAFVLVQHLDPKHESLLPELLSKNSPMPLRQVRDGMTVEPDHVYVIPPNTDMVISNYALKLLPRSAVRGQHMPIDHFLRSLAGEVGSKAIGIILSGSSTDGALGLEAIKAEGGITFAQDDRTAKYDGMPRAAAATGCVDFILPPEGIARELIRIGQHPYVAAPDGGPAVAEAEPNRGGEPQTPGPLTRIFSLLRSATSVDFSLYKHTTIRRRISRRMALHKVDTLDAYVDLLERNPMEVEALYREVLIKVTGFFRDPEIFQALKTKVFPDILGQLPPDTPIRIWIPGCSTGEEVYSIAISLLEFLSLKNKHVPIQIFATDISEDAIEKARTGVYIENIGADVSPERLRRFFVKHDGGYQVNKTVRDLCVFARQNLTKDPPFSKLDLISCRNVLIYLEAVLQKRVIPMFHYALKPNGYLLLGSSETITAYSDLFALQDKKHKIYAKRLAVSPHRFEFEAGHLPPGRGEGVRPMRPGEEAPGGIDLQKEADRLVLARYAPAGVVINEDFEVVQYRGKTGSYLEPAPGRASLNVLKMVREGLLLELRSAVQRAKRTGEAVHKKNIATKYDHGFREVDLDVIPLRGSNGGRHYLILFEEAKAPPAADSKDKRKKAEDRQVTQLKQELVATREYLQSIIEEQEATNEELQSANEEVLSSNEELQSINEELETAKEELQSTNEELTTVNEELQNRNTEVSQTNDDLTNLLSAVNFAIVMLGSDLRVRRFTPMAGKILNLIPTDLGRPITDIRPGILAPDLGPLILEVIDNVSVKECEVADAEGRWYSMAIRPYRTSDNRIDGAVLTLFDIDPLKRSLEQIKEARDFAQAVVETAAEPLIVLDRDRRISQANASFYDVAHVSPEEAAGKRIEQVLRGDAAMTALLERAASDELVRDQELEFSTRSGRITVLASARAIKQDGKQELILLSMREITRRKAAESELRASESLYRELFQRSFNSTTQGLLLVDGDTGEIREVNPFLTRLLGCTQGDIVGKKLWEVPQFGAIAESREAFLQRRSNLEFEDVALENGAGHEVPAAVTGSLYQAGSRTLIQFNIQDLSGPRSLEEQLRQAQKMEAVGRLAGGVAHDFNNLLTIITGYSELLVQELGPDHPLASQAGEVLHAANRAAALTGRLLVFSRRQLVHPHALSLNDVIASMETMLKPLVGERVEISLDLDPGLWPVSADDNQVEQLFLNLLVNAREAIGDTGKIRISTANVELGDDYIRLHMDVTPGRYVMLAVSDTGAGMSSETQGHIFEPFFTTKAPGKGTGLGLSTVYGIVKQSHGDIAVESEPHKGTTMRVYFPAASEPVLEAEPQPVSPESLTGTERILVVEDEAGVRRYMRDTLDQLGYTVFEAGDGEEALAVLESTADGIDLLLTDVMMPNMDGRELAGKLKQSRPGTRVLFVSGYTPDSLELPETAAFLQKPFAREDLARRIREMLDGGC